MEPTTKNIHETITRLHEHKTLGYTLSAPYFDLSDEFEHLFDKDSNEPAGRVYVSVFLNHPTGMRVNARAYQGDRNIFTAERHYDESDDAQESIKHVTRMIQSVRTLLAR